jgi:hypothetical protein
MGHRPAQEPQIDHHRRSDEDAHRQHVDHQDEQKHVPGFVECDAPRRVAKPIEETNEVRDGPYLEGGVG